MADGNTLISSSEDGVIRVWDLTTCTGLHQVSVAGLADGFQPLGISPDGRKVVSTSRDGTLQFWDTNTGKELGPLLQGHVNAVSALAFSTDGSQLVSGAFLNDIQVWDITRKSDVKIQRHDRSPHNVEFSPDGTRVRSWRPDSTKFWDTLTSRELRTIPYNPTAKFVKLDCGRAKPEGVGVQSAAREPIGLVDAESEEEWKWKFGNGKHPAAPPFAYSLLSSRYNLDLAFSLGPVAGEIRRRHYTSDKISWRMPLELEPRSYDFLNNFVAIGLWNGRVVVLYLPREVLEKAVLPRESEESYSVRTPQPEVPSVELHCLDFELLGTMDD
ncbi:hypothetical protein JAAARDRAFT_192946 [Jaapia argillacea MUCL 33604]|uniref:Uncharacterized protein n=1 Tax=Jaapia argillacea MUCL 33604 TaxID=933084 RepID=A0A067Q4D6_9AGAM|nr:hypothetical protein JAAARDRAFT_192946 [Jaapia argillacea MUCL 33604]